jgi:Flp pilus assembly protein TadB
MEGGKGKGRERREERGERREERGERREERGERREERGERRERREEREEREERGEREEREKRERGEREKREREEREIDQILQSLNEFLAPNQKDNSVRLRQLNTCRALQLIFFNTVVGMTAWYLLLFITIIIYLLCTYYLCGITAIF